MVPHLIRQRLNRLQRRESALQVAWIGARWLTVLMVVLAGLCALDWYIDIRVDTPYPLRVAMFVSQVLLWAAAAAVVGARLTTQRDEAEVALWVEDKVPRLGHRLISAVQLNREGAATAGMSPELIARVTQEAEAETATINLASLADTRRLRWSALLLTPLAVVVAILLLLFPETVEALVARQVLLERLIPRSVALVSEAPEMVLPVGEEVELRFRVTGPGVTDAIAAARGVVRVVPDDGQPAEQYELAFHSRPTPTTAIFVARVPPSSADFKCSARLKDARTRDDARVHLEARPVVRKQDAWVLLPASCGLRGQWLDLLPLPASFPPRLPVSALTAEPFTEYQKGGDIVLRLPGSGARVAIDVQKPVAQATLEIRGPSPSAPHVEEVLRELNMPLDRAGTHAGLTFRPRPGETAYRIHVWDRYGLDNTDWPNRAIRTAPAELPEVAFLPEQLYRDADTGKPEEYEVEGIPVLLGERFHFAYRCSSPYGLSHARLRYRVIKKGTNEGEGEQVRPEDWPALPLGRPKGVFDNEGTFAEDEFFLFPSFDLDQLGGTFGVGQYDFRTTGIADGKGGTVPLEAGDAIEFFVEVFDRHPGPERQPGRTWPPRRKDVLAKKDYFAWFEKKDDHTDRLRKLEEKQRGITSRTGAAEPDRTTVRNPTEPGQRPVPPPSLSLVGRSWQLLGPFPDLTDTGHARAYPPETESVNLNREYDGIQGKIRWQQYNSSTDKIDLEKFFVHDEAGVAYAVCWVDCGRRTAVLATGSDDGIKVWLNRKLVLDKAVHREAVAGEDRTRIELEGGWQELLVKVDNRFGTWAFFLELLDPVNGKPLQGVRVRLTPPEEDRRFVRAWQIIGPFANPNGTSRDHVYPPETEPRIDLGKQYDGRHGKVRWQTYRSDTDQVDLLKALSVPLHDATGIAYAVCWVRVAARTPAVLATGSDDGIRAWLNRKQVLNVKINRVAEPGRDKTAIELAPGWNEVLLKIDNTASFWGFFVELQGPKTGAPLPGIEYSLTPPAAVVQKSFIRDWQLIGPFPNPNSNSLDKAYPPETETKVDLKKEYDGRKGKVRWQAYRSDADPIDLMKALAIRPEEPTALAYAVCWVRSDKKRPAILATGSDDGIKAWINRKLVLNLNVARPLEPSKDKTRIELKEGWNEVLLKIDNKTGLWAFCAELNDPGTGKALEGLEYRSTPPP